MLTIPISYIIPRSTSALPAILILPSLSLLVAWLWARGTRPELPDNHHLSGAQRQEYGLGWGLEGDINADGGTFAWPAWYGQKSSPYDYRPPSRLAAMADDGLEKMKVLLDVDLSPASSFTDYALSLISTLRQSDIVDVHHQSGRDEGGNSESSIGSVEEWEERCSEYDVIWRLAASHEEGGHARGVWRSCPGVPIVSEVLTDSNRSTSYSLSDVSANITLLAQPDHLLAASAQYEVLKAQHGEGWEMGLFAHVLPAADPSIYYPKRKISWRRRVTYFPSPTYFSTPKYDRPVLPYDARWEIYKPKTIPQKLLSDDDAWRTLYMDDAHEGDKTRKRNALREWVLKEEKRRAEAMRGGGICLFDTWDQGLTIEMAQAMLSGCVVAAVVPDVDRDRLNSLILPLRLRSHHDEPDATIPMKQLEEVLRQTKTAALDRIALRAFMYARKELVLRRKVEDVRGLREVWMKGGRGYQFTSSFRWTCTSQHGSNGAQPPWC